MRSLCEAVMKGHVEIAHLILEQDGFDDEEFL